MKPLGKACGKGGDTQAELGKEAKEQSKEEPSRKREPHVHWLEGWKELSVLAPKEVHVAQVMLSSMVAVSHTGYV